MRELLKNFIIYGMGGIMSKLVVFLMLPIYTSHLSLKEYGYFDLVFSITTISAVLGMLQFDTGFQQFFYNNKTTQDKTIYISTIFNSILCTSIIVAIIYLLLVPVTSLYLFNNECTIELYVSCLEIITSNLQQFLFCLLRFDNRPKLYSIIALISALANAILCTIFVVVFRMGILGALIGTIFAEIIIITSVILIERKYLGLHFSRHIYRKVFAFSIPQVPARIGGVANTYINRFIMVSMFTVETIGFYSLGVKLASAIFLIQTAFQFAWLPYLYKILDKDGHKEQIILVFKLSTCIMAIVVTLITMFSNQLVLIAANNQYLVAAPIIGILSLYNGLFMIKETLEIGVKVTGKSVYTTYAYLFAFGANVLLLFILPKIWGLTGVAISLLSSNVVLIYLTYYYSNKLYSISYPIKWFTIILGSLIAYSTVIPYIGQFSVFGLMGGVCLITTCLFYIFQCLKKGKK